MRPSVSSRPSASTDSKMPGETVLPLIATRTGWKISLGFTASRSTTLRSAASIVSVEALQPRERVAGGLQALARRRS